MSPPRWLTLSTEELNQVLNVARNRQADMETTSRQTSRALCRDASGAIALQRNRPVEVAEGEVLIKPVRAVLSHPDVEVGRGLGGFSGVLGSSFVGVVEQSSPMFGEPGVGDRVVADVHIRCGACDMCLAGLGRHCRDVEIIGARGRDGCLADRLALPAANCVPVPDSVDDECAAFAVYVARAAHIVRQVRVDPRDFVTVLGDSLPAILIAQLLRRRSEAVRLVGRLSEKMSQCERWEIKHRHADDVGRRADQDLVIDCSDGPDGFELATRLVRPRGRVVLKSTFAPQTWRGAQIAAHLTPVIEKELEVIGSGEGSVRDAIGHMARMEVDVLPLISKRMSLDAGIDVLRAAAQAESIAILVDI